jgi:hypothetical protein
MHWLGEPFSKILVLAVDSRIKIQLIHLPGNQCVAGAQQEGPNIRVKSSCYIDFEEECGTSLMRTSLPWI